MNWKTFLHCRTDEKSWFPYARCYLWASMKNRMFWYNSGRPHINEWANKHFVYDFISISWDTSPTIRFPAQPSSSLSSSWSSLAPRHSSLHVSPSLLSGTFRHSSEPEKMVLFLNICKEHSLSCVLPSYSLHICCSPGLLRHHGRTSRYHLLCQQRCHYLPPGYLPISASPLPFFFSDAEPQ